MRTDTHVPDASPQPLDHFHLFPNLPPELRWEIWRLAICTDDMPRIHYYSLFNNDKDNDKGNEDQRQSLLQQMMAEYTPEAGEPFRRLMDIILPCLLWSKPSQCSWARANRFSYLWDAGLQTACKESRAALLHHLERTTELSSAKRKDLVTAHLGRGQQVRIGVCSKRDIVCFRFAPEDMEACLSLRWDVLLPRLPFYHLPYASDINLALEFHDSWAEGLGVDVNIAHKLLSEASDRGLAMRAHWAWMKGIIPQRARLYLIDRGGGLPVGYRVPNADEDDDRYRYESAYRTDKFPCEPQSHHFFIDGVNMYVECYQWEGKRRRVYRFEHIREVPALSFIWKMRWFCRPRRPRKMYSTPSASEDFFRVLRQLPGTDGTG